jgi:hypothetical protein
MAIRFDADAVGTNPSRRVPRNVALRIQKERGRIIKARKGRENGHRQNILDVSKGAGLEVVVVHHAVLELDAFRGIFDGETHLLKCGFSMTIFTEDVQRRLLHCAKQAAGFVLRFALSGVVAVPDSRRHQNLVGALEDT